MDSANLKEETMLATRTLILFALALCACGTATTNAQPPTMDPEAIKARSDAVQDDLNEAEDNKTDQTAPQKPKTEDPQQKPQITTVALTGKPLKVDRLDLTTEKGLDAFIDLVRERSDISPMVTATKDIASYSHSVCWSGVSGGMIFSDCLLYRIEGSTAIVLHLQGGLDTIVGHFTSPEGEYTYSCENDGATRGRNCYLVNLATGATSKNKMFLYSHPEVLVSPAGVVYLNDTVWQGEANFYDRIYTPDGIEVASSEGVGDFTFVAEAVVEKPVYEELRWTPGVPMEHQPRRVTAERIDLTNGRKQRIYEE